MTRLTDDEIRAMLDVATPAPKITARSSSDEWAVVERPPTNDASDFAALMRREASRSMRRDRLAAYAPDLAREVLALRAEIARLRESRRET